MAVCGTTGSTDFLNSEPPLVIGGTADGFYTRISADNTTLRSWRVLGGSDSDVLHSVAFDTAGVLALAGRTESPDFPTSAALDTTWDGWMDIVAMKVDADDSILFSTYLGGQWDDWVNGLAVAANGAMLLTGTTNSDDFPLVNELQGRQFDQDMFLTSIASDGQSLDFSTVLGGNGSDVAIGLDIDSDGRIWIAGTSWSNDFPLVRPFQAYSGYYDAVLCGVSADGGDLFFSSCFGDSDWDHAYSVTADSRGRVCLGGYSTSTDLPMEDSFQPINPGRASLFVARFDFYASCCEDNRGNVDYLFSRGPYDVNIADITFLVAYLFAGGPEPTCLEEADVVPGVPVEINIADLDYLISHVFRGGPALPPCPLAP